MITTKGFASFPVLYCVAYYYDINETLAQES